MNKLKILKFKDFISLQRGFDLPKEKMNPGIYPVVGSTSIIGHHDEFKVDPPGVVMGRSGSLGIPQYVPVKFWPHNTSLWVKDFQGNFPRYVYYLLQTLDLGRFNAGTGVPTLNRNHLDNLKLTVHNFPTQRKIADILSVYDELIEINQQRITLLERAGREIYREWFVRLRFPGYERTKIVDGVPEGWEQIKVGNLLGRIRSKKRIKKTDYLDSGLFPCVDQSREFIGGYTDDLDAIHETPLPVIVFGDHTRIVKFIDFPFARGADGTQLLIPNRNDMSVVQFYFALEAIDLSNYFYARHFKFLKHQVMLVPTKSLGDKFTAIAGEIMEQIKGLREQNRKLSKARDLLLPRLMSGQLAV